MSLLCELETALYLRYTSPDEWRRAKQRGHIPEADMKRGKRPVEEFWLEESLIRFIAGGDAKGMPTNELRRRIGGQAS